MDFGQYQKIIKLTAVFPEEIGIMYCTMGLTGEAGEVADKIKKRLPENINLHAVKLQETETSYAEWYAADN